MKLIYNLNIITVIYLRYEDCEDFVNISKILLQFILMYTVTIL